MRTVRFHQGFVLRLDRLAGILRAVATGTATTNDAIAAAMGVNIPVAEGFRGWLCKTGLGSGTASGWALSPLGRLIFTHDPDLQDLGTLWLLHAALASTAEERADVWYMAFARYLMPGIHITAADLAVAVGHQLEQTPTNRAGIAKDAALLIQCYTQIDSLGALGIMTSPGPKQPVMVGFPAPPPPLVAGYHILRRWPAQEGGQESVRLSLLVDAPESIGRVGLLDRTQVRQLVDALERLGVLIFADTQFEPVTRRYSEDPLALLVRYYQGP